MTTWIRGAVLLGAGLLGACATQAPPDETTTKETHFAITPACAPCAQAAIPACLPTIDVGACIAACAPNDVACLEACVDAAVNAGQALDDIASCVVCDQCAVECDGAWNCAGSGGGGVGGSGVGGLGVGGSGVGGFGVGGFGVGGFGVGGFGVGGFGVGGFGVGGSANCDGSGDCATCVSCAAVSCGQQPDPTACLCGACASDCANTFCP